MTFDTIKSGTQRKAFTVIEIILDKNDPALDTTFAMQSDSYATPKTTDDPAAYTGVDFRTYRYSDQQLFGVDHFPNLVSVQTTPPKIDPGKSMGFRSSGTAQIRDFISDDIFELPSPYDDRRVAGSHLLKLLARNHYKNRRIRVIRGYDPFNYSETNTQIENYIIDSFSKPNEQGISTIKFIDELILTEEKKAKAPAISLGTLTAGMSDATTSLSFVTTINEEYGAVSDTGFIAIEKEIMSYTVDSATTMTVVRGQKGTVAAAHEINDTVQKCIEWDNVNIIDIITDLIGFTKIPTSYIPTSDWNDLKTGDLSEYNLSNTLFKPEDVKKLLNQLIHLAGLSMYVDVINQEIVIVTVPDFATPIITFDETEHLIQGTVKATVNEKKQITRQSIFWDKAIATETDDEKNYRKRFSVIDLIVEGDADLGVVSEPKPLLSNWIVNSIEDNGLATNFCQNQVSKFSIPPQDVSFEVDQRYIDNVTGGRFWLGSIFNIKTDKIVNGGLDIVETTCQCISLNKKGNGDLWSVKGLSYIAAVPPNADYFIETNQSAYDLAADPAFAAILGDVRDYIVVINSGVVISDGFDQGTFPVGATLSLINLGSILGTGGDGGEGGDLIVAPPNIYGDGAPGSDGQTALTLTTDGTIDNAFGQIFGGGGGAGGFIGSGDNSGNGGGGGQGSSGGSGGSFGLSDLDNGDNGPDGSVSGPGGNAGEWGEDGPANSSSGTSSGGPAIDKSGNSVTITSGNNSEQIKGDIVA